MTQKNRQSRPNIFTCFHGVIWVQSSTYVPHGKSINGAANPEIVYFIGPSSLSPTPLPPLLLALELKLLCCVWKKYSCWSVATFSNWYFYLVLFGEYVVLPYFHAML